MLKKLKSRASQLKTESFALYLAARHPETSWYAKVLVTGIIAYAFSPIDLIPDFVPILGYLDDLILLPIFVALAIKLVPDSVLKECRDRARETFWEGRPESRVAGAVIVLIWLSITALIIMWTYNSIMAP